MRDRRLKGSSISEPSGAASIGNDFPRIPDPMDGLNVMRSHINRVNGTPGRAPDLRTRLKEAEATLADRRLQELQAATHLAPVEVAEPAKSLESPELRPALTFRRRDPSGESGMTEQGRELD